MSNSGQAGPLRTTLLGLYMIVMAIVLVTVVFILWPAQVEGQDGTVAWSGNLQLFGLQEDISADSRLILLVLAVGALGSYVHGATSFISYVGNRSFHPSWTWWYVLRPLIGMALAVIFYFVIRGGLLGNTATAADVSPFGIAAVAGLVGMFSKQATDKLEELFNNLFRTAGGSGDARRADKLGANREIRDVMLPLDRITTYVANDVDANIPLADITAVVGPGVSRVPIVEPTGELRYLVHQSVLAGFLAQSGGAAQLTLDDLVADGNTLQMVRDDIAFVAESATAGDAKAAMESINGCQDVIVTASGSRTEPVVGWVTNVELGRIAHL